MRCPWKQTQGGSARRNAYQWKITCEVHYHWLKWAVRKEEKVWFKSVKICLIERLHQNFFIAFCSEDLNLSCDTFIFLFYSFIVKMWVFLFEVYFFTVFFFCLFSIYSYIFPNNNRPGIRATWSPLTLHTHWGGVIERTHAWSHRLNLINLLHQSCLNFKCSSDSVN